MTGFFEGTRENILHIFRASNSTTEVTLFQVEVSFFNAEYFLVSQILKLNGNSMEMPILLIKFGYSEKATKFEKNLPLNSQYF